MGSFLGGSQTSSGTSTTTSPYAGKLANWAKSLFKTGFPVVSESASQMLEGMRTGGVNSFIPWISRAVDASRQSGSQSIEGLRQNLARSGFGGTLGGQGMLSEGQAAANQQTDMLPSELIQSWISGAPSFGMSVAGGGLGALGTAGGLNRTTTGSQTGTSTPGLFDWFSLGAGSPALGAAAGALF